MVFSLLLAAVLWNLGTWARGHADWRHVRLTPSPLAGETGALREALASIRGRLDGRTRLSDVPPDERWPLRADALRARQALVDFDARGAGASRRRPRHLDPLRP